MIRVDTKLYSRIFRLVESTGSFERNKKFSDDDYSALSSSPMRDGSPLIGSVVMHRFVS
jgi:hypothetical protein